MSDFITIECALNYLNLNILNVYNVYTDLNSKNTTLKVKDKNIFISNNNETRLIEPIGILLFLKRFTKIYR